MAAVPEELGREVRHDRGDRGERLAGLREQAPGRGGRGGHQVAERLRLVGLDGAHADAGVAGVGVEFGRHRELERGAAALDREQDRDRGVVAGDAVGHLGPGAHGDAVDGEDLVAGAQAGGGRGGAVGGRDRGGGLPQWQEGEDGDHDQSGRQDVGQRAGHGDQDLPAPADVLVGAPRRAGRGAEALDLDVAPEGQGANAVAGAVGAVGVEAGARAPHERPEPDRELGGADPAGAGGEEVPELVDGDEDEEGEHGAGEHPGARHRQQDGGDGHREDRHGGRAPLVGLGSRRRRARVPVAVAVVVRGAEAAHELQGGGVLGGGAIVAGRGRGLLDDRRHEERSAARASNRGFRRPATPYDRTPMAPDSLRAALLLQLAALGVAAPANLALERPRKPDHGDWSVNCFPLAKGSDFNGPALAQELADRLNADPPEHVEKVEVIGGFLKFPLRPTWLHDVLRSVLAAGTERYAGHDDGGGTSVNIEFVSANPTGPLHAGHGRWAAYGDSLARILDRCGYVAHREFYVNDRGVQTERFGASLAAAKAGLPVPEDGYKGAYVEE